MATALEKAGKKIVDELVRRSKIAHRCSRSETKDQKAALLSLEAAVYWDAANVVADSTGIPKPDPNLRSDG